RLPGVVNKLFAAAFVGFLFNGCAGYHIGPVQPAYLRAVKTIAVPTFANSTLEPRIEVLVTGTVIKQFQQDGTYRIAGDENADAILKGEITRINRAPSRSVRGNVLATREFTLRVGVRYRLVSRDGKIIAGPSEVYGTSNFFVGSDVTTDERQALPLATEEVATHLVSQLSEGW
ncbi:MAG: LptE family protein, partial [Verrucomicrobiota bacterium]